MAIFVTYAVMWIVLFGAAAGFGSRSSPSTAAFGAIGLGAIVLGLAWLALIIPVIAVQVRRLHDTDRSGWWLGAFWLVYLVYAGMLIGSLRSMVGAALRGGTVPQPDSWLFTATSVLGLVMFVYSIVLLVFFCLPGTRGANRFGEDPYGPDVEQVFA